MKDIFVAIAGNIGAGKSTVTGLLSKRLGWHPFYEANAENPYLADFYEDMRRWSFHSQMFFLGKRLEHHRKLLDYPGSVVQDRTVYEDAEIFAENLYRQGRMSDRDYETYCSLYKAVSAFLPAPDLVIYLEASVDTLMHHIQQRGREFEQNIERDYIANLNDLYDGWINRWTASPVLRVNMNKVNFLKDINHLEMVVRDVKNTLHQATA